MPSSAIVLGRQGAQAGATGITAARKLPSAFLPGGILGCREVQEYQKSAVAAGDERHVAAYVCGTYGQAWADLLSHTGALPVVVVTMLNSGESRTWLVDVPQLFAVVAHTELVEINMSSAGPRRPARRFV